ncbi:hypothetical protein AVEN_4514-1 [Araneus ventricosus]|uniref:Uncharacterized protein n=1 Tax=Araneus ventricosus TaxID=182803 RepID=A0A4Y2BNN7_ARAVE|nr:hypothetical protein AVEN_4514-1 [Araneus ventricosus]
MGSPTSPQAQESLSDKWKRLRNERNGPCNGKQNFFTCPCGLYIKFVDAFQILDEIRSIHVDVNILTQKRNKPDGWNLAYCLIIRIVDRHQITVEGLSLFQSVHPCVYERDN